MRPFVLAALVLIATSGSVIAATEVDRQHDWVRIEAEIQRATRALATDADGSRPAVESLLKRINVINGALDAQRDESAISRAKRSELQGPIYNLRSALDQPAMASRMVMEAAQPHGPLMSAEGVAGVSCEQAIELVAGQPMRIEIPTSGSRWIAVRSPLNASVPLAISTVGSDIDAAVNVFADCREIGKTVISSGDDNYGLQAIALLPPAAHPLMVELRNQGERGIAMVDAVAAVTISGRITRSDTSVAIANIRVEAYQGASPTSTQYVGSTYSQANGDYVLTTYSSGAGPNTYVRTNSYSNQRLFVNEAWDNILCSSDYGLADCGPGTPTAAATADGGMVSDINFALSPGGTIYGQVLDRSGNSVSGANISINQAGAPQSATRTTSADNSGRYRVGALATGQYRVAASASGYKTQVFRDYDCETDCTQIAGTPVAAVEFGQSLANFSLSRGNSIRVSLTVDGQPLTTYGSIQIIAVSPAGLDVAYANAYYPSTVAVLGPLPAGTYRVRVEGTGLISEYFQDVVCAGVCGPAEFQAATPLSVANDSPPVEITVDVTRVPELAGIVTSTSGAPIANATITLFQQYSQVTASTDSDGSYRVRAPSLGSYFVHASSPNHIDEVFDNIPCNSVSTFGGCAGATPINFSVGVTPSPVNFELAPSSVVRGRVTKLPTYPYFQVYALTSLNQNVEGGSFSLLSDGAYQLSDLPQGQFRFGYSPSSGGRLQLFQNIDCGAQAYSFSQCPATGATPVTLVSGSTINGIDFTYRSRNGRLGQVTDEATGLPLSGIILDAYYPASGQFVGSVTTDADGRFDFAPDYGSGPFFLATDNYRGYVNEVYNNIECAVGSVYLGTCPLTGATPIAFPGDGSELSISLRRDDAVFRSGFD